MIHEEINSHEGTDMVYSDCAAWFHDWVKPHPPTLEDDWDLSTWMDDEMTQAVEILVKQGFRSIRGQSDAVTIIRAFIYEFYLFEKERAVRSLVPLPAAVERILTLPQTDQKSKSWYRESRELLTGHEFGTVVYGSPNSRKGVIMKKCTEVAVDESVDIMSSTVFCSNAEGSLSAFKWGWRYEPVVRTLYETCVAGGPVNGDIGRVRHPTLPRLAASPDGLILSGAKQGRLLEIKCPITRDLTGEVPMEYWCQMQLQAEVCDVDAVEYVEARLSSLPYERANELTPAVLAKTKQPWMGVVAVISPTLFGPAHEYQYSYSPLFPTSDMEALLAWTPDVGYEGRLVERSIWWVGDWFTTTVLRNRRWWTCVGQPAYESFWKDVDKAREGGTFVSNHQFVDDDGNALVLPLPSASE
jgi:hypothetical protein